MTLDFIDGRLLSIGLKDDWINGADDGSDSWEKRWTTGNWPSSDHARPELEISIMPDSVDVVDLADILVKYELPLPTGPNHEQQTWLFDMPQNAFAWKSYRAKAKLSELDIQLIPDDEPNHAISVEIPNDKRLKKIWKPWWRISKEEMTGEDFGVSFMLAVLSGGHQDLAKPTPSLYQVRSHPKEIERWARLAVDDELPYYGIAGMLSPEGKEYYRRDMRRKFGKELTIIEGCGNISLHQLAEVFSDPNWLEDRLSKFWGWNSGDD